MLTDVRASLRFRDGEFSTVQRGSNFGSKSSIIWVSMQIKSIQRTGIISDVRLPETGQVSAQRKVAPIRDTYEDGSRRYEPLMKLPSTRQQPQGFKFSVSFDLHKFFMAILLQQGRMQAQAKKT